MSITTLGAKLPVSFLPMCCVNFVENASFKSFGDICQSPLPSPLLDKLSVTKRDSNGFFSRKIVGRSSDSSYNSTDSSLNTVNCQLSLLISSLSCANYEI